MDFLFNLFLISVRPLGLIFVLAGLTYLLPMFLHRGTGNPTYKAIAAWRWKVAPALALLVLVLKATSPTITPQNSTKPSTVITVPVEVPATPKVDNTRKPRLDETERDKRFEEITDWRKSNATRPAEK